MKTFGSVPSRPFFTFLAGLFLASNGIAASAEWSALGDTLHVGQGITPGIAMDARGTLHLVSMHDGAIYYRQRASGESFGPPESLPRPEGSANYNSPHVVCGPDGVVHVVFERDFTKASRKAWYTSRRNGQWRQPILIIERTEPERRVNYPRLTLDGNAAWVGAFAAGGSTVVRLSDLNATPRVSGRIDTKLWVAHAFPRGEELLVIGRAGAAGHKLERYDAALRPVGEPLLLSRGTPTKTYESTAVLRDPAGGIHVVGTTGAPAHRLWYTTEERARQGGNVVLGPDFGTHPGENTYPVTCYDRRGRLYVSYRDHTSGEARLTVVAADAGFAPPITIAAAMTRRLRWNAHLAPAADGGVYIAWDHDGEVFVRPAGVPGRRGP